MDLSRESLLNMCWSHLPWFQHFNTTLNEETVLPYFCQFGNPFYDRSSLNEYITMNNLPPEAMLTSTGIEYALIRHQDGVLFIIRKHYREGPNEIRPLQEYYVIAPGNIFQAPDTSALVTHRLLTVVHHLSKAFDEVSQKAAYHPSSGYYWKSSTNSDDLSRKDGSKEKIITQTQRARFESIFPQYLDRFRSRVNNGTSNTNNVLTNDTNIQRKEDRTPSDSQATSNERPMVEVKKQKIQK